MRRKTISESQLRNIVKKSVKKILKESRGSFNEERFYEWEEKTHIPEEIRTIVKHVCDKIGCPIDEEMDATIRLRNRGGYTYAYGKGFTMTYCTSSMESGPSIDYSDSILKFIKGLGFKIVNSYGDNGMDSATNYQDTFWSYDFVFEPSIAYYEAFMDWGDEEYDDDGEYDYDEGCYV